MYKNESINKLAKEYIESGDDKIFEKLLLTELSNLINSQLAGKYSSIKSFWEDMRQDVFLKLWENRKTLDVIKSKNLDQHFYRRIQDWLNRSCGRIRKQYDSFNPRVIQSDMDKINIEK